MKIIEIGINDARYPNSLRVLNDPPSKLYCAGNVSLLNSRCVCVVGSRKTTAYGRWAAGKTASRLAGHGVTVVSGLAVGIDASAHQGALSVAGNTIAVLGCGLDISYPWANRKLKEDILESGLLVSEYSQGTSPTRYTFPRRNRIISGLSSCAVLIEAGLNSGALITAEYTAGQGKEVYVIPGNINSACSLGSNMLLRDGAVPLAVIDDILEYLHIERDADDITGGQQLGDDEKSVLQVLLAGGEMTIDEISSETKTAVERVSGTVAVMEMKGLLYTAMGKVFLQNK